MIPTHLMGRYVALLRGINVGGKNIVKMAALEACFEASGLTDVVTYIQSGNILFRSGESSTETLTRRIERLLETTFGCRSSALLRTRKQMRDIVTRAPDGFGAQPARYRYDVIYLMAPLTAAAAVKSVPTAPGVDQLHAGPGVLYFSRLVSQASRSRLSKVVSLPIYRSMTIRNWNTTTTLLRMLDESAR
jgi:uncharacterized protein (DUF1697 family)